LKGKKTRTFFLIKIWFNYYIQIVLPPNEEESKKPTTFTIKIKNGIEVNLQVLKNYITSGTELADENVNAQTCMAALNTFLNYKVRTSFLFVGKEVYPSVDDDKRIILNTGEELRKGYRQSLRIGWGKLSYNLKYYNFGL